MRRFPKDDITELKLKKGYTGNKQRLHLQKVPFEHNFYLPKPVEYEDIDDDTHYNDRVTVALRTCEGLDLNSLSDKYRRYCLREAQRFLDDGLLSMHDSHLTLTRKGLFVSDYIMSSLVFV